MSGVVFYLLAAVVGAVPGLVFYVYWTAEEDV